MSTQTATERTYGAAPAELGVLDLAWDEYMTFLYLPVVLPGVSLEPRLPERTHFVYPLLDAVWEHRPWAEDEYVYLTAKRGFAVPGNPLNRPGWHSDGFGTADRNYVWTDRFPTLFAVQPFVGISDDHIRSIEQFEEQLDPASIRTYPDKTLLGLDPSVIHAAPEIPAPGGERGFVKISVSKAQYNLRGNSHNYLFDYDWKMWDREEVRNDPARAGRDAA